MMILPTMRGVLGKGTIPQEVDLYPTNTMMLVRGNEVYTDHSVIDSAGKQTLMSSWARFSDSVKKFGPRSLDFQDAGISANISTTPSPPGLDFGSGAWTIESWINLTTFGGANTYSTFTCYSVVGSPYNRDLALTIGFQGSASGNTPSRIYVAGFQAPVPPNTKFEFSFPTTGIAINTWYHLAVVRSATQIRVYIDGTLIGSVTVASTFALNASFRQPGSWMIGSQTWRDPAQAEPFGTASKQFMGFMDDYRVTAGVARYNANFTPAPGGFADP